MPRPVSFSTFSTQVRRSTATGMNTFAYIQRRYSTLDQDGGVTQPLGSPITLAAPADIGVDVPFSPIRDFSAFMDAPQAKLRRAWALRAASDPTTFDAHNTIQSLTFVEDPTNTFNRSIGDVRSGPARVARRRSQSFRAATSMNFSNPPPLALTPQSAYQQNACEMLEEIQRHLLEQPIDGGLTWSLWTREEVLEAINFRLNSFVYDSGITRKSAILSVVANTSTYNLPTDLVELRRVEFTPTGGGPVVLDRIDTFVADSAYQTWDTVAGAPTAYVEEPREARTINLVPEPSTAGALALEYIPLHTEVDNFAEAIPERPCADFPVPAADFASTAGFIDLAGVTQPAHNITNTSADLRGTLNAHGQSFYWFFKYGTTPSVDEALTAPVLTTTPVDAVVTSLVGLSPGTTYYYQLHWFPAPVPVLVNVFGTCDSGVGIPQENASIVFRHPADDSYMGHAVSSGAGAGTPWSFNFHNAFEPNASNPISYEFSANKIGVGGRAQGPFSITANPFGSLLIRIDQPNESLTWTSGTTFSSTISTFTTSATPPPPAPDTVLVQIPLTLTQPAHDVTHQSATLRGSANAWGQAAEFFMDLGFDTSYGINRFSLGIFSDSTERLLTKAVSGLTSNTTYHFRILAIKDSVTYLGDDQAFTTICTPFPEVPGHLECQQLDIPSIFAWAIKWGTIATLLAKEGEANDPQRAEQAEQHYQLGIELAKMALSGIK